MVDFLTTELEGTVRMWSWRGRDEPRVLYEHKTGAVCFRPSIAISPDGRLAITSHDGYAYLWDMVTGRCLVILTDSNYVIQHASISSKLIVTACSDDAIRFYKHDGVLHKQIPSYSSVYKVHFSPDGQQFVSYGSEKIVLVWNMTSDAPRFVIKHSNVRDVAWSWYDDCVITTCSKHLCIWDTKNGNLIWKIAGPYGYTSGFNSVAWSPDGEYIATGNWKGIVQLWCKTDKLSKHVFNGHNPISNIWAISFSANGKLLASASNDNTVRIWDITNGICLHILQHKSAVQGVAFCPVDRCALMRQQDTMFAVAIICDQLEIDPYLPREVWSEILNNTSWRDFVEK